MESHACHPSTGETEARGFGHVQVQLDPYNEAPCVRKQTETNKRHDDVFLDSWLSGDREFKVIQLHGEFKANLG